MTFEEEYEILLKEKDELFAREIKGDETPFPNCVVRRALRCIRKLKERYLDAEEQGLILRLPCKVGDVIWEVEEISPHTITECKVDKFATDEAGVMYINYHSDNFGAKRYLDAFGDTLFLTKKEAGQKQKMQFVRSLEP